MVAGDISVLSCFLIHKIVEGHNFTGLLVALPWDSQIFSRAIHHASNIIFSPCTPLSYNFCPNSLLSGLFLSIDFQCPITIDQAILPSFNWVTWREDFQTVRNFLTLGWPRGSKLIHYLGKGRHSIFSPDSSLSASGLKFLCRDYSSEAGMMEKSSWFRSDPWNGKFQFFTTISCCLHTKRDPLSRGFGRGKNSIALIFHHQLYKGFFSGVFFFFFRLQFQALLNWASYMGLPNHVTLSLGIPKCGYFGHLVSSHGVP